MAMVKAICENGIILLESLWYSGRAANYTSALDQLEKHCKTLPRDQTFHVILDRGGIFRYQAIKQYRH